MPHDQAPGRPDGPPPSEQRNSWLSRRRVLTALGVIGGLCILLGVIIAIAGGTDHAAPVATASHAAAEPKVTPLSPLSSATGSSSSGVSSSPASSLPGKGSEAAPTLAAVPHTIATYSGSGIETTPEFTTTATWQLAYSFNCSQFGGPARAEVVEEGGSHPGKVLLNESTLRAEGRTRIYGDPGSHYLKINSPCSWVVKVVDQP